MNRTKNQRLLACFDLYQDQLVARRPCTTEEVAEWMMGKGLWPTPGLRDAVERQAAWEQLFETVKATVELEHPPATETKR